MAIERPWRSIAIITGVSNPDLVSDMDAATGCCIPQLNTSLEAVLKYRPGLLQNIPFVGWAVLIVYVLLPQSPRRCQNETVVVRSKLYDRPQLHL